MSYRPNNFYLIQYIDEDGKDNSCTFWAEDRFEAVALFNDTYNHMEIVDVFVSVMEYDDDEPDGQPDEAQEWHDFDPDC
jgi:hypothetical protein